MKELDEDEFFAQYPRLSNFDELKKADVLVMPRYSKAFSPDQGIFDDFVAESNTTCLYYSEDQEKLHCIFLASVDTYIQLGTVVSTIADLITIYVFLKSRMDNQRFQIKHVIKTNNHYHEFLEFEGTIEQYTAVLNDRQMLLEALNKK